MAEGTAWSGFVLLLCFGFLGGLKLFVDDGCAGSNRERDHEVLSPPEHEICAWNTGHGGRVLVSMNSNFFYPKQFTMKYERGQDRDMWPDSGEFEPTWQLIEVL